MSDDTPEVVTPSVVPVTVSIADIMNDHSVVVQRESESNALLTSQLLSVAAPSFIPALLQWASLGYPPIFPILRIQVDVPEICADGVSRQTQQFVEYNLGMPLSEIVASISTKLLGMDVSYSCSYRTLSIHVSKSS
jgi:hypothetical protein